jgi:uncharacterized surface protein with fasciclin (FAS1) repeats
MKKVAYMVVAFVSMILTSCSEEVDTSARYVFKEEIIAGYLEKHEQYSEYCKLLKQVPVSMVSNTSVFQLLSARGNYTVFAPTNEAIQLYLDSLVKKEIIPEATWEAFDDSVRLDSIRKVIVYNSIIDGGDDNGYFEINSFPTGSSGASTAEIEVPNLNDRKLVVTYTNDPDSILINDCMIDRQNRDIQSINGVVHCMHNVVAPSGDSMATLLRSMIDSGKGDYVVMAKLMQACGLMDTLDKVKDEVYEYKYQTKKIPQYKHDSAEGEKDFYSPEHRYYGFTIFAETDAFWSQKIGKPKSEITVEDIYNYIDGQKLYPDAKRGKDYKDEDNLLNQFVTYHMLPMRLSADRLVNHYNEKDYQTAQKKPTIAIYEFYTTMGKRRLLKTFESKESNGVYLNRFPNLNNGRRGDYHENSCDPNNIGILIGEPNLQGENNVRNGIIYPIDELLWYSDNTRNQMMRSRIRWNVTAMWPEFMNNDIRISSMTDVRHTDVYIPTDAELGYQYLNDVIIEKETKFLYWTGRGHNWANMQGDEMSIRGLYEVTMRLPPVPARGTYELRFGQQCGGSMRGMAQFYWGKDINKLAAMGIPMDLRQGAHYLNTSKGQVPSDIGYEADTKDDDDYNAEVDKRMRNNDFMKGCQQYAAGSPGTSTTMRASDVCLRRIMLRQTMDPNETYYVKFKTVMDDPTRFFYMDYMEYCAKEVYDNPAEPEDIW